MRNLLFIFIISSVLLFSCTEDEEINPSIETVEAKAESPLVINAKGVIKIKGSYDIIEYGFAYSHYENLVQSQKIQIGVKPNGDTFDGIVPVNLYHSYEDVFLYVAAYITNTKGTVYGNMIKVKIPMVKTTTVSPLSGKVGDKITIIGNNFALNKLENTVLFNQTKATVVEATSTKLIVEVPPNISTSYYYDYGIHITVQVGQQQVTATTAFRILPEFTSFSPQSGALGTQVTIYGSNIQSSYNSNIRVLFGDKEVSPYTTGSSYITAYVPDNLTSETFSISIMYYGVKIDLPGTFTVAAPIITSINSEYGIPGNSVIINGNYFCGDYSSYYNSPVEVYFGSTLANIANRTSTRLTVTVPNLSPGTYSVKVKTKLHETTFYKTFLVLTPEITSFSPASGGPGTELTIYGKNFSNHVHVTIGSSSKIWTDSYNSERISVIIPYGLAKGENEVKVESAGTIVTAAQKFYYEGMTISSITPTVGPPGTIVTIDGNGFNGSYYGTFLVKVGSLNAKVISRTNTRIILEVPTMAVGKVKITIVVNGESLISDSEFEVTAQ